MNSVNLLKKQVNIILNSLEKDLYASPDPKLIDVPRAQKESVKNKLCHINEKLTSGSLPHKSQRNLGLSHAVSDNWPFDSTLGEDIMNIEKAYVEL